MRLSSLSDGIPECKCYNCDVYGLVDDDYNVNLTVFLMSGSI